MDKDNSPVSPQYSESEVTAYYDANAETFFAETVNIDVSDTRQHFTALLPDGAKILDAGCGSGRDTKHFLDAGYRVTAFDASSEMVRLASAYTGIEVLRMTFQEMRFNAEFDGIWASATLLHLPKSLLPQALSNIARALRPGGVAYISFKYGSEEGMSRGGTLFFTGCDETLLESILPQNSALGIIKTWTSEDKRQDRKGKYWLHALLQTRS